MGSPFNIAWTLLKSRQILKFRNPETGEAWSSPEAMDEYISDLHESEAFDTKGMCNNCGVKLTEGNTDWDSKMHNKCITCYENQFNFS